MRSPKSHFNTPTLYLWYTNAPHKTENHLLGAIRFSNIFITPLKKWLHISHNNPTHLFSFSSAVEIYQYIRIWNSNHDYQ